MQYLLFICAEGTPAEPASPPPDVVDDDPEDWVDEMTTRGVRLFGEQLAPPSAATTVRVRNGDVLLTDGPFAETKELICGFDVIECRDLDEAIEVASKHPVARFGMVEVRPFWTPPGS